MTNKDVAAKYGVPKNTLSTWAKNKHKLTTSLEKNVFFTKKNIRCGSYDQIDKVVFHRFVGKRGQKIPNDGILLKEKALEFAKTLGIKESKASIVGSISGRKGTNIKTAFYLPSFVLH